MRKKGNSVILAQQQYQLLVTKEFVCQWHTRAQLSYV